jgi:peptidoglycan/LPS O-acetylase OafA/YrhL
VTVYVSAPTRGPVRSHRAGAYPAATAPAAPAREPEHSRFRPDIEGLRAVAVLAVVAYHAGVRAVPGGYVGVDVFFVISGFLITRNLCGELWRTGRISFSRFYGRRVIRLLPASTVVVLATLAAAWHWMSPLVAKAVSIDALAAVAYGINVRLAIQGTDYLAADREPSPLQHFWSLAVEEQFYVVWPLLLVVASAAWLRRGRRPSRRSAAVALVLLAAGSLALCGWQTRHSQPWAYFGIQARAWELATGALVALAADRLAGLNRFVAGACAWAGLATIVASARVYTDATLFPGYAATLPVAGAALVIAGGCARRGRGARLLLGLPPMQAVGRLSYGWYLWHWPVLTLAPYALGHPPGLWVDLVLAGASLILAWLSLVLVENRFRFHPVLRRRPRRGLALGAMLTAITVGATVIFLSLPLRVTGSGTATNTADVVSSAQKLAEARQRLQALIQASVPLTAMPANLVPPVTSAAKDYPPDKGCLASLDETSTAPAIGLGCDRYGDRNSATTLVLFGDSHTEQWFDAANAVALRRHWRLVVLTKSGCTPADALTIKINARRPFTECTTWREDAFRVMASLHPSVVLMSTRTYLGAPVDERGQPVREPPDESWATALLDSAVRVRQLGARTVVMQDTPDPAGASVPDCVAAHPAAVQRCALKVATAIDGSRRAAIAAAAVRAGIAVIDPTSWFCTDTVCPPIVGNTLVYRDGSHITSTYIKLLSPLLDGELPG